MRSWEKVKSLYLKKGQDIPHLTKNAATEIVYVRLISLQDSILTTVQSRAARPAGCTVFFPGELKPVVERRSVRRRGPVDS